MASYVIEPGAGPTYRAGGGALLTVHKVVGELTGGSAAVAEHILKPKELGSPRHTHRREHEISYVIAGTLAAEIGGTIIEAGPGTTVYKPKDVPHAFWNPGDVEVRFVEVFAPAGFEHYFVELDPLFPPDGPPDFAGLAAVAAKYDLDVDRASTPELIERHGLTPRG
jgi:mannose-6-phosphate isomerase-like protein (cupin superfamily)